MVDTPQVAGVAHLIGDPTRAIMLAALKDDGCLSAMELARIAGVAPSTASGHLTMLVNGRLIAVDPCGRHRYYRLARPEVADTLEAMEALAVAVIPADRLGPPEDATVRFARLCYDHLAGRLGVELTRSLSTGGHLKTTRDGFTVTRKGRTFFAELGIDLETVGSKPRVFARKCPDWSERHFHLGGALGAALLGRFRDLGWLRARKGSRSIEVTGRGRRELAGRFGLDT